ncbi:MAG: AAA family ATPase [Treponema sp.]
MLTKFAVTNYRGFSERIEWDLTNARDYEFNVFAVKDGIIKNGIIYGPNGSGKSNFALALFDIVNHLTQNTKKTDYYNNFVYAGAQKKPVIFEYSFRFGNDNLQYVYAKDMQGVLLEEKLTVNNKESFNHRQGTLSVDSSFSIDEKMKTKLIDTNSNHISIINFLLTSFPLPDDHYLIKLQDFVNSMLWFCSLETREFIGLSPLAHEDMILYIIKQNLVKDFAKFLENTSEQHFDFVTPKQTDKRLFCFIGGMPEDFYSIASTGTHSLTLLYYWIKHMDKASFVFVDEFDAFYHYKLSEQVCRELFKLNCQVFLSSHNTSLMTNDLLRPDCNFVLKDNKIQPLCDCTEKDLRFGHNIEKLFRGGTFDA